MALVLCISAGNFASYQRHSLGLGLLGFPHCPCRVNLRFCPGRGGIRCTAAANAGKRPGGQAVPARRKVSASHSQTWDHAEPTTTKDNFEGWEPLDRDHDIDRRVGLLRIAGGVILGIACSVIAYTLYSRKGSLHSFVSETTQQVQKALPSRSTPDESRDAHKPLDSDSSTAPSSNESKEEVRGEKNPQPDHPASASDLQEKKKTAPPGQDSFPSKDVTKLSDEEDDFSSGSFTESDLESNDPSNSEKVDKKFAKTAKEPVESSNDGQSHKSVVKQSGVDVPSGTSIRDSPEKSVVHKGPGEFTPQVNVLERENEQHGDVSVGNAGNTESIRGPEESSSTEAKHETSTSIDSTETMLRVSASVVVPKEANEDMLEFLGLDTESNADALDRSTSDLGLVNRSPSVLETLLSPLASESSHSESVESIGIPAPSTPSTAAQARSGGSVVVRGTVDHEQEQALAALQALKVIEPGVDAGGICTRREYARWLIAITGTLARSPAQKVFPAMYVEAESELAFNDVVPEDADFPYIQGLAEAGLISSNLSRHDADANGRSTDGAIFLPDSSLSRQDLVSWKVALEGHTLQATDKQKLKEKTGFLDIDRINKDALPFLTIDLAAGERSIISTVFGYTRRFQPGKPVTRGQAAMALVTGEAADIVAEELTRLEADAIAEAAVITELSLEARAQKQVDEYFNTELKLETDTRLSAEKRLEEVKTELERVMKEREDQRLSIESCQAAVEIERDLLHTFRQEMEDQLHTLTTLKVEVGIEKDRLELLRKEAEGRGQAQADLMTEIEVEKKALILARLWAEDEAKKARAHAKMLEDVRRRWEGQGIEVRVSKDMDDDNIPALGWRYSGPNTELNKFVQRPPLEDILARAGDLKSRVLERLVQLLEIVGRALAAVRQQIAQSFQVVREKGAESLQVAGGKAHVLQRDSFSTVSRKAKELQDVTWSTVAGASTSVSQGTRKFAGAIRGEAQKFAGKFKS